MSTPRKYLLALALLGLTGVAGYEASALRRQRDRLLTLKRKTAVARESLAALRRNADAAAADLKAAETQLAQLPAAAAPATEALPAGRHAEIKDWLARVRRLQQLFMERPDQRIPELQLMTDADWLRVAKRVQFDSAAAEREALANARNAAKAKFAVDVSRAANTFVRANPGETPTSVARLAAYFEGPVDMAMLQRFEVATAMVTGIPGRPNWVVREIAAIDPDYDSRHELIPNGGGMTRLPPFAWIPNFSERMYQALVAYREAHQGASPSAPSETLPYMNPPLDPALAAVIREREKTGRF